MSIALLVALFFVTPLVAVGIYLIVSSRARGGSSPRCGHCQYNLTGSESNRCPECGRLFIEAGVVKQRRAVSRPRFWIGVAVLCIASFFVVGGLLSSMLYVRARTAQAQAIAAQQAALQQALLQPVTTGPGPTKSNADDGSGRGASDESIEAD